MMTVTHFKWFWCLRVRVERVTSAVVLSQHLQQTVLSQQNPGVIELDTLTPQAQAGTFHAIDTVLEID